MPPRLWTPSSIPPTEFIHLLPIPQSRCLRLISLRPFSSTAKRATRQRIEMFRWMNGPGAVFKNPLPGSTNYLNAYDRDGKLIRAKKSGRPSEDNDIKKSSESEDEDGDEGGPLSEQKNLAGDTPIPKETADDLMPFPLNRQFKSQRVLSDALRDEIYRRIVEEGQSVQVVSAELEVEMRRVGAVVRLKSVEKQWIEQGKRLAIPYAKAVMGMLPQTPFYDNIPITPHEPINDLPVHRATIRQNFYPVSESRHFTRVDAGQVFRQGLLPAEARIPHPELVQLQQRQQIERMPPHVAAVKLREMVKAKEDAAQWKRRAWLEKEERLVRKVIPEGSAGRAEFRFRDIKVESVGKDGRAKGGVGARYGFPHEDRKKGLIKIPRRVE